MVLLFFIQQKVPRGCPRKNVFFRIRNISKRKQASEKKHAEHCLRHLNKTACEICSVFDKVLFCVKYLPPFFHRTLQLLSTRTSIVVNFVVKEHHGEPNIIVIELHSNGMVVWCFMSFCCLRTLIVAWFTFCRLE